MVVLTFVLFEIFFPVHAEGRNQLRPFAHYSDCQIKKEIFRPSETQKKELGSDRSLYEIHRYNCPNKNIKTIILGDTVRSHIQVLAISNQNEVEILKWNEPEKYKLPQSWFNKINFDNLNSVDAYSGATLSVGSTVHLIQRAKKIFTWIK